MRQLLLLASLCAATGTGCVSAKDKGEWAEAMKDLRGDNMGMQCGADSEKRPDPIRLGKSLD